MVRANCKSSPCHSPGELKGRLKELGVDIEDVKEELLEELRELEG